MAKNIFNILIIMILSLSVRGAKLSYSDHFTPKESAGKDLSLANGIQEWGIDVADTSKKAVAKEPKKRSKKKDSKEKATTPDSVAVEGVQSVSPPAGGEEKSANDKAGQYPPQGQFPPQGPPPPGGQNPPQGPPPPEGGEPRPLRSAEGVSSMAPQQGLPPQVVGEAPEGMVTADSALAANQQNGQATNAKKGKKKKKGSDKKVTFETFDVNYAKALKYYNNGQYLSAARIFEELYPLSMGTTQADTILFLFADCYYKNKDFEMAAFHFKDYAKRYPGTDKAEYAYYLCVKSVFEISPVYSLDQSSTLYAIDEMDLFIKNYPRSEYVEDCNKMLDILHEKLAKKDFEILKLYYNTDHFQAVQIAAKNFLKEHPSSAYASESVFILIKSNLEYAKKSVQSKKRERFQACVDAFDIMQANFSNSLYYADAKKLALEAKDQISKLK